MTKTEARKLARQSTRYGYYRYGVDLSAICPQCRHPVGVKRRPFEVDSKGRPLNEVEQLRRAVFDHLQWGCDLALKQFDGVYR